MDELDRFRDFRSGVAAPSGDVKGRAFARLDSAITREQTPSTRPGMGVRSALRGGGRWRLIVLAAAALIVVAGTASAFGTVRDFILDRGFIGLPPEGATPSAPDSGELIVHWQRSDNNHPSTGHFRAWVYADGRIIWDRASGGGGIPGGPNEFTSGYLEQRLTQEGVDLLRLAMARLLDRSRGLLRTVAADPRPSPFAGLALLVPPDYPSWHGVLEVPDGDGLIRLQWQNLGTGPDIAWVREHYEGTIARPEQLSALRQVEALLSDPASAFPADAWAVRGVRAYVPSHYAVCIHSWPPKDPSQLLSLLPARAADVLRDKHRTRYDGDAVEAREGGRSVVLGRSVTYCSKLRTEEARGVADALSGLDREPGWGANSLAYRVAEGASFDTDIWFQPYFPHGQFYYPPGG